MEQLASSTESHIEGHEFTKQATAQYPEVSTNVLIHIHVFMVANNNSWYAFEAC